MLPIKLILHATDFSPCAEHAFHVACALARDHGSRLKAVHVLKTQETVMGEFGMMPPEPEDDLLAELEAKLKQIQSSARGIEVGYQLLRGEPATQIVAEARAIKCDLIVLGLRGHTRLGEWASTDRGEEPDVVMACCGDVPTLETLAAVQLLHGYFPELKIRTINVVDLMKLQPESEHPHGLSDRDFDTLFTKSKPIIFAFHGYPWLLHRLAYRRINHHNLHVRGYKEKGMITTPFDMVVLNDLDRFHLVGDVVDRLPQLEARAGYVKQALGNKLIEHKEYIHQHGEDMPEIRNWKWTGDLGQKR